MQPDLSTKRGAAPSRARRVDLAMIQLAEMLPPTPSALWTLARQMGLDQAVGGLPFDDPLNGAEAPWDYMPLLRMK